LAASWLDYTYKWTLLIPTVMLLLYVEGIQECRRRQEVSEAVWVWTRSRGRKPPATRLVWYSNVHVAGDRQKDWVISLTFVAVLSCLTTSMNL